MNKLISVAAILVFAASAAVARPAHHHHVRHHTMHRTSKAVYTCAMHPEVRMHAPGKCPKCGMKLVKM
ncbi:MAG: hypothetical protein M3Y56_06570 [Armatimonadota bacterium]|nr:hypothetical protein [Armatimonadota bacterium]